MNQYQVPSYLQCHTLPKSLGEEGSLHEIHLPPRKKKCPRKLNSDYFDLYIPFFHPYASISRFQFAYIILAGEFHYISI